MAMKLRKGRVHYRLPPFSAVKVVLLEGNTRHNQMYDVLLPIVSLEQIMQSIEGPAMPRRCAIRPDGIWFDPPPDKPYSVRVQYFPPLMEC